ncbi:MAG: T9SS type A sorting domain-containing protein [Cytophagaceae bacterium]|nr:T9SS type A sorting domain-containing protein [Cytophagaceae bacterium]
MRLRYLVFSLVCWLLSLKAQPGLTRQGIDLDADGKLEIICEYGSKEVPSLCGSMYTGTRSSVDTFKLPFKHRVYLNDGNARQIDAIIRKGCGASEIDFCVTNAAHPRDSERLLDPTNGYYDKDSILELNGAVLKERFKMYLEYSVPPWKRVKRVPRGGELLSSLSNWSSFDLYLDQVPYYRAMYSNGDMEDGLSISYPSGKRVDSVWYVNRIKNEEDKEFYIGFQLGTNVWPHQYRYGYLKIKIKQVEFHQSSMCDSMIFEVSDYFLGAIGESVQVPDLTTHTRETIVQEHIQIFPNPNQGNFYVEHAENKYMRICDAMGQLVYEERIPSARHSIALDFPKGMYVVYLEGQLPRKMLIQ